MQPPCHTPQASEQPDPVKPCACQAHPCTLPTHPHNLQTPVSIVQQGHTSHDTRVVPSTGGDEPPTRQPPCRARQQRPRIQCHKHRAKPSTDSKFVGSHQPTVMRSQQGRARESHESKAWQHSQPASQAVPRGSVRRAAHAGSTAPGSTTSCWVSQTWSLRAAATPAHKGARREGRKGGMVSQPLAQASPWGQRTLGLSSTARTKHPASQTHAPLRRTRHTNPHV
mmetsp:Transcript_18450/g.46668  ORF Transcript_18450/g.46668 Transcript_18450/m.46668 type:complete len:225 (+) Transcript_18450:561-1235(+)